MLNEYNESKYGGTPVARERELILAEAAKTVCNDRNAQYGEPEDNFAVIAELWAQYLRRAKGFIAPAGEGLNAYDVGMMMLLFKIGRLETGAPKRDSFVDAAGYIACAAEIAMRTKGGVNDAV